MWIAAEFETIRVNVPGPEALITGLDEKFRAGHGFAVATLNLDHMVKLATQPEFREAYARHDMVTADGHPVVWLHRLAGTPVTLAPGSELILPLCRLAARRQVPVAFVGSTQTVLNRAAERLTGLVPGLEICARIAPSQGFDPDGAEAASILQSLDAAGARLVFLALGAPKQERFAAHGRASHPCLGFVSIGAGLDFIAGQQRRAPLWMRRIAQEWLWRMLHNPIRLGPRYLACFRILPGLTAEALRLRRARGTGR